MARFSTYLTSRKIVALVQKRQSINQLVRRLIIQRVRKVIIQGVRNVIIHRVRKSIIQRVRKYIIQKVKNTKKVMRIVDRLTCKG